MEPTKRVVIGMDPHKRSVTIEVMAADETILGGGRFATDEAGFQAMVHYAQQWPDRVWAVEGCNGIGHHVAIRLLADGKEVVDVPPKLSAPGAGVRHRPGPQDRRHRRALGRPGRHPDGRAAAGGRRRAARGAADPGRPPPLAGRGPHPDGRPAAPPAARADPGRGEEGPVRRPGQGTAGQGPTPRRRRQDPPPGGRGADRRPGADLPAQEGRRQGAHRAGRGDRHHPDWTCPASDPPVPRGCWSRSATSPASPTAATSRPGTAPRRSTPPPATTSGTGCRAQGTGRSTAPCTSWPPSNCAIRPRAATTTTARRPPARPRWKPCAA